MVVKNLKTHDPRTSVWKTFDFLRFHRSLICALLATSVIAAMLEGVVITLVFSLLQTEVKFNSSRYPYPLGPALAYLSQMSIIQRLQIVAIGMFLVTLVKNLFLYAGSLFSSRLQIVVIRHFRLNCVRELMRVGMNYFNQKKASDFQIIIDGYTDSVTGAIVGLIATALPQFFTTIVLLGFLFLLSWQLTLAALGLVVIASFLLHYCTRNILVASKLVYDARFLFNRYLLDIINGMKLIRLFSQEERVIDHFKGKIEGFNEAKYKADQLILMVAPAFETIGISILAVILLIGSFVMPPAGGPWLASLFTFIVILSRLISPIKTLNYARATIIEKIPMLSSITSLLSMDDKEILPNGSRIFKGLRQAIVFDAVHFQYRSDTPVVLHDVSLRISKGQKVGLVGPSGSGKSTIIELLLRFYDPQAGRISVDGVDLKEWDYTTWRNHVGVVSQDIFLFNDTIRHNIAFADPQATDEQIKEAARLSFAQEFIIQLPQGYDTVIGERGVILSGGQRQRLAIARALLKNPKILIFDEATSSLDSASERYIQEAMVQVSKGRTLIVIAHRLSTVFDADQIFVFDKGRIIESGRHSPLIALQGLYARLVKLQELETQIIDPAGAVYAK